MNEKLRENFSKIKGKYKYISKKLRWFTPVGEADAVVRSVISEDMKQSEKYKRYTTSYRRYRYVKRFEMGIKILLYAGIITSFAAAVGLGLEIINRLASYIGFTLLIIGYSASKYLVLREKEDLYVRREILLSDVEQ